MIFFQQEELSRYDPERDLPYDPLQPSIRASEEGLITADKESNDVKTMEYVPSGRYQLSGTSFQHDPNIQSSTIENLDDDDDEDVYDPNKPTLFQQTTNTVAEIPTNSTSNTTAFKQVSGEEGKGIYFNFYTK